MEPLYKHYPNTAGKGREGEAWVRERLERIGYEVVNDYTQDVEMQRRGIDFGVQHFGWQREYYLDVKNNLYFNTRDNATAFSIEISKSGGKPGWFLSSQSNRIYHVNTQLPCCVYYDLAEMRRWVIREVSRQNLRINTIKDGSELIFINTPACPLLFSVTP